MPPFMRLITIRVPGIRISSFAVRWMLIWGTFAIGALLDGRFGFGAEALRTVGHDMQRLIFLTKERPGAPSKFPLLRDYSVDVHIWMIGVITVWGGEFMDSLSRLIPRMRSMGSLQVLDQQSFNRHLLRANNRMTRGEIHVATITVAVLLSALGSLAYQRKGIYGFFTPAGQGLDAFSLKAWSQWWARPFSQGSLPWLFWAVVGNYADLWIGYIALEVTVFFFRVRKLVEFRIDGLNSDGMWGWAPVAESVGIGRRIAVAASLGLGAIALIASPSSYYYLALFPLTFVIAIGIFLVPNMFYRAARLQFFTWPSGAGPVEHMLHAIQRALVPERIVRTRDFIYQVLLTAVPGIIAIATAVKDAVQIKR